jgi:hypothetical protein
MNPSNEQQLKFSDWLMLIIITLCVFLQRYYVLSSDPLLAWPITDSIAHPGRYPLQDILIQAGTTGNFVLYKLLAYLPFFRENFPLRDLLIYLPIYFLTLLAWWKVFMALGATRLIATISILLLVISDGKLSLNWAHVVPAYFISATSVHFMQVFAFLWFLKNQRNLALFVTAASGYFHPASALSLGAVYIAMMSLDAIRYRSWSSLKPALVFTITFAPTVLMILLNNQGSLVATKEYFEMFERYQPQAYLADHFKFGYAYTLVLIAFFYRYHKSENTPLNQKSTLFFFILVALVGCIIWLFNLYLIGNLQLIHTFFIGRLFSLIHPLLVFLTVSTAAFLYGSSKSHLERVLVVLFALTPMWFSPSVALIIVLCLAAYALGKTWWPTLLGTFSVIYLAIDLISEKIPLREIPQYFSNAVMHPVTSTSFIWFQIIVLFITIPLILLSNSSNSKPVATFKSAHSLMLILFCATSITFMRPAIERLKQAEFNIFVVFDFHPENYWGVRSDDLQYAELLDWVHDSSDQLYSVPPYDDRFLSFRYLSGKGTYIFHRDIAQLMYSPNFYLSAIHRLKEVAGDSPELPKAFMNGEVERHNGEYENNCRGLMVSDRFDAIIFERKRLKLPECLKAQPVFQNDTYLVLRTSEIRLNKTRASNQNDELYQ